ncbi:flagellar basal body P-ring protein FlgI [Zooshikella marina]|uniref:Flagellar P-ring protein n=1 Tax=Zooshikella ganghwensis TaxID=202772 RepID=A0A4P9VKI0_9GAMM|nr:flagellar basal body P-ring protein FlgI [Zooshikella ganghwensis]MBU2704569.1 flagellar basal body P-ring protein FlgI [Zooshikella ganghwensis]RDH43246.1 flagellar basal body P-ring protein FlgI [Zooshikella ganghwensis]
MLTLRFLLLGCLISLGILSHAERLKDLATISGVRSNQLVGYGLVVGLDGTGDKTSQTNFTIQSFNSMLKQFGINLPPGADPKLKNIAAVAIHGELPPFAKPGQTIDITVSSIGNAKSLRGGSLLITPLKGLDGRVYAIAQGNLVVGGLGVEGLDGSKITINVPSVGRIPNGAMVERAAPSGFNHSNKIVLNLNRFDFTTAKRVTDTINQVLGPDIAQAVDGGTIEIQAPLRSSQRVTYMSVLENLEIAPGEAPARVVINSRTGTIVIGKNVRVSPAAVTHGNLVVSISENTEVSQPNEFGAGDTVQVPQSDIDVTQEKNKMFLFSPGVTLDEIVQAVNQVGAAPGDLMAILEALKQAGALNAELVVI